MACFSKEKKKWKSFLANFFLFLVFCCCCQMKINKNWFFPITSWQQQCNTHIFLIYFFLPIKKKEEKLTDKIEKRKNKTNTKIHKNQKLCVPYYYYFCGLFFYSHFTFYFLYIFVWELKFFVQFKIKKKIKFINHWQIYIIDGYLFIIILTLFLNNINYLLQYSWELLCKFFSKKLKLFIAK